MKRIFDPYFSTKEMDSSGTGLGLAVVYGVIKDHNAYYDVTSSTGCGTEFIFYFPVSASGDARGESDSQPGMNGKILIVDTDGQQRAFAGDILSHLDYDVVVAANGREANEFLQDHPVDLVFLDATLEPDLDGLDTYLRMVKLYPHQRVIIVGDQPPTDRVRRMQDLGAGPYIRKPFNTNSLAQAVKAALTTSNVPENI
jgi:CheY-like chemotaxis protein